MSISSNPLCTSQIFYIVIYFTVVESRLTIISSGIKITKFNSLYITPLTQIQCLNVRFSEHYPTVKGCDHSFTRLSELLSLTVGNKLQIWRCPFLPQIIITYLPFCKHWILFDFPPSSFKFCSKNFARNAFSN